MEQRLCSANQDKRLVRMTCSLEGLSVRDASSERLFRSPDLSGDYLADRVLPPPLRRNENNAGKGSTENLR